MRTIYRVSVFIPFLRAESEGIISDSVWNGNTLSGLSGVGSLAMKNNLVLSLASSPLLLL